MKRRNTRQRQIILEILRGRFDHPTADQLYVDVRERLPKISLGTVYRNLDVLVSEGLVRVINVSGQARRFDGNVRAHDHIRCVRCGRIKDLAPGQLPNCDDIKIPGFRVLRCSIEVEGICLDCVQVKE